MFVEGMRDDEVVVFRPEMIFVVVLTLREVEEL